MAQAGTASLGGGFGVLFAMWSMRSLTFLFTKGQENFTLHAELEGMKLRPVLERLLAGWRTQGHALVSLAGLQEGHPSSGLARHRIAFGRVPGRSGLVAVQGERVERAD